MQVPSPIRAFYNYFPLKSYPPILPPGKSPITESVLWIQPPRLPSDGNSHQELLSADVECLKWQAYLALRGISKLKLRWDVAPEGAIDEALPNLHVPISESPITKAQEQQLAHSEGAEDGQLLAAHSIPAWVDSKLGVDSNADPLEGYRDHEAKVESRAWVSLLEGVVHAAVLLYQPKPSALRRFIFPSASPPTGDSLKKILSPPPPPITGFWSIIPPTGTRISVPNILSQYRDAITSLATRLGTDKWFLGSAGPTALDALLFAYLHCILHSHETIRADVKRQVNLVAWEWRVRALRTIVFSASIAKIWIRDISKI